MKYWWVMVLLGCLTMGAGAQGDSTIIVHTKEGALSGLQYKSDGIFCFKGVPFAAPPVGNLRWKAPQPLQAWTGVKSCHAFAASAIQPTPVPFYLWSQEFIAPATPLSEDCLYLNIWSKQLTDKKPVIVWIHGGGLTGGSGSVPIYDGTAMAQKGVVFVTINYRLGVFGFLAHPDLTSESERHASGNYGLLDQLAALQWIKNNIAAFGGDPEKITIAGQSAGAISVCALMASPLAHGLFANAIAESGGMFYTNGRLISLSAAEKTGQRLLQQTGLNSINELRNMPAEAVLAAAGDISSPVIDGYFLPSDIYTIFKTGKQNDVPLLTGWNNDEGFMPALPLNAARFQQSMQKKFGALAPEVLNVFPAYDDEAAKRSQQALSRDEIFAWHNYTWATLQAATGRQKAWLYIFSQRPPGQPDYGAFHSAEVPYALHTLDRWNRPWTNADRKVEDMMNTYWINFATTGNPNGSGLPEWPSISLTEIKAIELKKNSKIINRPLQEEISVLNKYQAALRGE